MIDEQLLVKQKLSYRLTKWRWLGLLVSCMTMFGSYYCFDNPQALQSGFQDPNKTNLNDLQFNLLYSVYSFPNIILPLVGGMVIDKIGVRKGIFIFTLILIIGQSIFTLGGVLQNYWVLLAGRFVFGLGGECLCVAQSTVTSNWFKGKELALALGLNITISRLGSSLNSALTPILYQINQEFLLPMGLGLIFCIISWIMGLLLIYMDRESDIREGIIIRNKQQSINQDQLIDNNDDQPPPQKASLIAENEQVRFKDIFTFSSKFWILVLDCALIYGSFFAFNGNANYLLQKMYSVDTKLAGIFLLSIYCCAAVITPFFGSLIDKYGRRAFFMIISNIIFIIALVVLLSIPNGVNQLLALIPLVGVGIFYATYAAIFWPCIPLVVPQDKCGTAFGVVNSVQNINLVISPLVFGLIKNKTDVRYGYFWAIIFLIIQNIFGLLLTIYIYISDIRGDQILNSVQKTENQKLSKLSIARR